VHSRLRLVGTPLRVLGGARFPETLIPLTTTPTGMTTAVGVVLGLQLSAKYGEPCRPASCCWWAASHSAPRWVFGAIGSSRPPLRTITAQAGRAE